MPYVINAIPKGVQNSPKPTFLPGPMKRKQQKSQDFLARLDAENGADTWCPHHPRASHPTGTKDQPNTSFTKLKTGQIQGLKLGETFGKLCQARATPQIQGLKLAERPNALRKLSQARAIPQIQGLKLAERPNALRKLCQARATPKFRVWSWLSDTTLSGSCAKLEQSRKYRA